MRRTDIASLVAKMDFMDSSVTSDVASIVSKTTVQCWQYVIQYMVHVHLVVTTVRMVLGAMVHVAHIA